MRPNLIGSRPSTAGSHLAAQVRYVPFEEERMGAASGPAYDGYASRVRRWS